MAQLPFDLFGPQMSSFKMIPACILGRQTSTSCNSVVYIYKIANIYRSNRISFHTFENSAI